MKTLLCACIVAVAPLAHASLKAQIHVAGLHTPVAMIQDPTNSAVQMVVQQSGRIQVLVNGVQQGTSFLNLTGISEWNGFGSEGGLLGLVFDPNYAQNRYFYVNYTDLSGDTNVVRYTRDAINPLLADPNSGQRILWIGQPFANHNGGTLRFGPDGYLYVGMGDGGSGWDPGNRAQTITNMLLGKMLRLDPTGDDFPADPNKNYKIPPTNPFVGITGDDEIWDLGLRNPWKFSFDDPTMLGTGALVIADVGQMTWEEIDYEPALKGGRNYGWRVYEGNHETGRSGGGNNIPFTFPIYEYPHSVGRSITGGYVYRGTKLADHFGRYFFVDYMDGDVYSIALSIDPLTGEATASDFVDHTQDLGWSQQYLSSVDVDSNGELYVIDYVGGRIWKLLPENEAWPTDLTAINSCVYIGGLRHILGADNKPLQALPIADPELGKENQSTIRAGFATDLLTASSIAIRARVGANQSGAAVLHIGLTNWGTGQVDVVGVFAPNQTYQEFNVTGVPAANYLRNDGRIELQLRAWRPGYSPFVPYRTFYDLVDVDVQ